MKRVIVLFLACIFLFSGCQEKQNHGYKVKVIERWDIKIVKQIENATDNLKTGAKKNVSWYDLTPTEFMENVNKAAEEIGYAALTTIKDQPRMYSLNGETWYIIFNMRDDVEEAADKFRGVELSLFSDSDERAKMNGFYLYTLIEQFNPGMAEIVSDELGIFDADSNMPEVRQVICGLTQYTYSCGTSNSSPDFQIDVVHVPPEEEPTAPAVIKPS